MAYLIGTSVLMRLANQGDPNHAVADRAVFKLHRQKETLHITAQNLIEFRNAATRPKAVNGLGMAIADAEREAAGFEKLFPLLPEDPRIFLTWKPLVSALGVIGKQVHDARLVAICHVNSISHILTFNVSQFTTLATFGPGVAVVDPATV